ncbi:protein SCO1 homolog 1, mitochondrial isoform X1 [Diospyros lotus]|uniref:protein SCO1 homolog 1, mitochondrial isoform X1 n=1 Tax=Diospyros lotus TaxID=55363 RepID=UPI00224EA4CC|nr:protein SCO1 homolog 1, mitochondrial isoform X1 [Diospyros lotus]
MVMASATLRNASLRYICRSLTSHALGRLAPPRPYLRLLHGAPETLHRGSLPLCPSEFQLYHRSQCFAVCPRYFCSSTGSTTVIQSNSATSGSSEGSSGQGEEKPGQSQRTAEQGKPVRGGILLLVDLIAYSCILVRGKPSSISRMSTGSPTHWDRLSVIFTHKPVSWLSFLLLVATGAGLIFYYDREKKRHIEEINNASNAVKQGPSVGKAAIGGPFSLVNHNGKAVTDRDFLGKWTVIYFGFTHCPDICPDELQKLAAAVDKIKEKAGIEIVPVFISVDPERDTVEQVHEYVEEFHPSLVGLTGNPDEIKKAARAFRVYYMKTEEEGSDYLVDHSIVMYLMDPSMEFVKFFGKNNDVDQLADGIIKEVKQHKKTKA